jgi:hypothetical protein
MTTIKSETLVLWPWGALGDVYELVLWDAILAGK